MYYSSFFFDVYLDQLYSIYNNTNNNYSSYVSHKYIVTVSYSVGISKGSDAIIIIILAIQYCICT